MNELERKLYNIEMEIRYLRNDSPLSNEEKSERINKLEQEKSEIVSLITYFDNANKRIEELEGKGNLSKEERKELKELNKNIDLKRKDYNKKSQGKYRDLLSAYFGQIDKRIHNRIYKNNSFWRSKNSRVDARYANIRKYFAKNFGISAVVFLVPSFVSGFVPVIAPYVAGAFGAYLGQTIIKTVATIYNKARYGGPRLTREYQISKNGYFGNIGNCWDNILNNSILSKNDVKKIQKNDVTTRGLGEPTDVDSKDKSRVNNSDILSFVSSVIYSCDIEKTSMDDLMKIVNLVENNNLSDQLGDEIKKKYLLIKSKLGKKDESQETLINTINMRLENIDINAMTKEEAVNVIKFIDEHHLYDKISDKAREKYNSLKDKVNESDKQKDDTKKKIEFINSYISGFDYGKTTIKEYEDMFKYVTDNDLEKELSEENKKKYQQLKIIYNAMIKIREIDLNNLDIDKANDLVKYIRNNKITKKLNSESYEIYQKIASKLKMLTNDKDNTNKKDDSNYKEKLIAFSQMLSMIDLSKLDLNELSSLIKYVHENKLEKDFPEILEKLNKIYDIKIKNEPKMKDYGNKKIGVTENIKFIAEQFIKHPPKMTKDMKENEKNLAFLARKIRNGNASSSDMDNYIMLVYELVDQESFLEEYSDYLMEEYDKYQSDKEKYDGKKAK